MTEIADTVSKVYGKGIKYKRISNEAFRQDLHSGSYAGSLIYMMLFQHEFGYDGLQTKALVEEPHCVLITFLSVHYCR